MNTLKELSKVITATGVRLNGGGLNRLFVATINGNYILDSQEQYIITNGELVPIKFELTNEEIEFFESFDGAKPFRESMYCPEIGWIKPSEFNQLHI